MNVSLTLSVDEDVLDRARQVARHRGTSLNALVRKYIDHLAGKQTGEALARELQELWKQPRGDSKGKRWKREDLYEERLSRYRR